MQAETGMIRRGTWQGKPRQRSPRAPVHRHGLQALKGRTVIQPVACGEGNHLRSWDLPCLRKLKCGSIRQARQGRQPRTGAKRWFILSQARVGFQREAAFIIRRVAQFNLTFIIERHGAQDHQFLHLQDRRFRMEKRSGRQSSFRHGSGGQHRITK